MHGNSESSVAILGEHKTVILGPSFNPYQSTRGKSIFLALFCLLDGKLGIGWTSFVFVRFLCTLAGGGDHS